ncbi:uncharacterized protein [Gossypium hirsutum]|uniref:Reverse transcriptase domain-containing protein n=1 Tax=Gossypium hirsutum TaxID=3635 RepID=A0A1U8NFI6_GOSHI|nr:uncharacterized protein LOC107947763 [Gossypium hirsutum]
MAPYDALYGHRCRTTTCWTELGERRVLGPELISDTKHKVRKIRDRLKAASDRQKSYTDLKRKEIEYSVEDLVFLKEIKARPTLTLEEELDHILDRDVKVLRRKLVPVVKSFGEIALVLVQEGVLRLFNWCFGSRKRFNYRFITGV